MIDFKDELKKFSLNLEIDEMREDENLGDIQDILELLQHLSGKIKLDD
ncbi:MAG: hypothetical protein FWB71_00015 [Defluviitaleaceae bacterium]|nr:hypothetical protein [Defluviitaleaceae bacterium]